MHTKWAGHVAHLGEVRKTCKIFLRKPEACVMFGRSGVQNCTTLSRILNRQAKGKCHGLIWHPIRTRSDKKGTNIGSYAGQIISSLPNLPSVPEGLCSSELVPKSPLTMPVLYSKKNKQKEKR